MKNVLGSPALQTRVGRRFLTMFFVSAFVPVCALAVVTWQEVRSQLQAQVRAVLGDEAKRLSLDILSRLQRTGRDLRDLAARDRSAVTFAHDSAIDDLVTLSVDGRTLRGRGEWEPLTPSQRGLLESDHEVILTRKDVKEGEPAIWLAVRVPTEPEALLAGRLRTAMLIDDAIDQVLALTTVANVTTDRGLVLQTPNRRMTWPGIPARASGALTWEDGSVKWIGAFFKPPMEANYGIPFWVVSVGRREELAYAPVQGFLRQFVLIAFFTLGVVSLLSLRQVKRQLVPLSLLRESTVRLAERDFSTPISLRSGDEFQDLATSFDLMRGALRQTFDTLAARSQIDRAILSSFDPARIVDAVVGGVARIVPSSAVACIVARDATTVTTTLWRADSKGHPLTVVGGTLAATDFPDVREWTPKQFSDLPRVVQPLANDKQSRLLTVPIHIDQRPMAVLVLVRSVQAPFRPEDRDILIQIGQQVAVALTNAGLVQRLERLNLGALNALARTIDAKSPWTRGHSERVTVYGVALARRLGLDEATVSEMRRGGLLHDIGKIGIPNNILDKQGGLTIEELQIVRRHPELGARILEPIAEFRNVIPIVLEHHERWDGGGYPAGLSGEAISLGGRIFALADVFDALTSHRPYRAGMSIDRVTAVFTQQSGRHFDPKLTPLFVSMMPSLLSRVSNRDSTELTALADSA